MLQAVCQLLDMNREHAAAAEHGSLRTWMMTMKTAYFHKTHDSAHELCVKTKKKKKCQELYSCWITILKLYNLPRRYHLSAVCKTNLQFPGIQHVVGDQS